MVYLEEYEFHDGVPCCNKCALLFDHPTEKGGKWLMTDKELNEMIEWCKKKMLSLPFNYTGKRKEGYKEAMLQVMSYLHSRKGGEQEWVTVAQSVSKP